MFAGATAGCLGGRAVLRGDRNTDQTGDETGSGRCHTEAQSHPDDEYATVENVGVLDGEVFVSLDSMGEEVATARAFRDGDAVETFDLRNESRLAWPAPDVPFKTTERLVLQDESGDRLTAFEFSADCSAE